VAGPTLSYHNYSTARLWALDLVGYLLPVTFPIPGVGTRSCSPIFTSLCRWFSVSSFSLVFHRSPFLGAYYVDSCSRSLLDRSFLLVPRILLYIESFSPFFPTVFFYPKKTFGLFFVSVCPTPPLEPLPPRVGRAALDPASVPPPPHPAGPPGLPLGYSSSQIFFLSSIGGRV